MRTLTRLVLAAALPAVIVAAALVAAPAARASDTVNLTGAGATFPYPLYSKWIYEYNKLHPAVQINYQSIGSGGGIRQITEGTVDFAGSDAYMSDDALAALKGKLLHIPMTLGAVVITYNIPNAPSGLKLTPEALSAIYLGTITKWNDPQLAALNPDFKLPSDDINVVHRSDGSGTTAVFSGYLSAVSADWASKVGKGTS